MLQRQNPIVALVAHDFCMEFLDRSRRPLDDVGEHASVRQQRAGDVVQGIAGVAMTKDIEKVAFKTRLVRGHGGMAAVDKLHNAELGTELRVQRHFR